MTRPLLYRGSLLHRDHRTWWVWGAALLLVVAVVSANRVRAMHEAQDDESARLAGAGRALQMVLTLQLKAALGSMQRSAAELSVAEGVAPSLQLALDRLVASVVGAREARWLDEHGDVLALSGQRDPAENAAALVVRLPVAPAAGLDARALEMAIDAASLTPLLRTALYADDMQAGLESAAGTVLTHTAPAQPATAQAPAGDGLRWAGELTAEGLVAPLRLVLARERVAVLSNWRERNLVAMAFWAIAFTAAAIAISFLRRRQRSEAVQRRSEEERLALALRGGDLGLWDLDLASGRMLVDARANQMLGLAAAPSTIAYDDWRAQVHPQDWPKALAAHVEHLQGRSDHRKLVYRMRHADGHWIWALDRGKVLQHGADGEPVRMLGTRMDISARIEAEEALRRSEQSLAVTLHSIGDAVIAADAEGRVTRMNAAAVQLTGWSEGEAIGRPLPEVFRIVDPHSGAPLPDPVALVISSGEVIGLANGSALIRRDGSQRQINDSAAPIRTAEGQIVGVVLVFSDVTERYRVEQALQARERELSALTDAWPGPAWHADLSGHCLFANAAFGLWFGLPSASGPLLREAIGPDLPRVAAGETVQAERQLDTAGGQPRHVLITLVPDRADTTAVQGYFAVLLDISELRSAELRREQLERQLREAQKMEAIGTLAGGIAHDFNNIMAAILGQSSLAADALPPDHAAQAMLRAVQQAGLRGRSLVRQILSFSRRETGPMVPLPLAPLVDETLAMLRAMLPAAVTIERCANDAPVPVQGDPTQIQQVLVNLVTNAWHALPAGGGRIEIGFERVLSWQAAATQPIALTTHRAAHLWVRDEGSGMSSETLARVFEPFFTTKATGHGTGLGLAVVHGIVQAHGGVIAARSEPGRGSTFHLWLPSPEVNFDDVPASADLPRQAGAGEEVLVVDDDEVVRLTSQALLQRAGYRVAACASADEAQRLVIEAPQRFDAIVTDFNMAGQSGLDLARQLLALRADLIVILTTGLVFEGLRERARQAGICDVLQKENNFEELAAAVQIALARRVIGRGADHGPD